MDSINKRPTIGLALGSGGARGLSHIGVIKVLEKAGIIIDCIAGSSVGSWIGAWYAKDLSAKKIEQVMLDMKWQQLARMVFDLSRIEHSGGADGDKAEEFIRSTLGNIEFSDLKLPLKIIATDLKCGDVVTLQNGDLPRAIRASMSVPAVFKPIKIGGRLLVDGGLSEAVPVSACRSMEPDIVIAVNLDAKHLLLPEDEDFSKLLKVSHQTMNIVRYNLARCQVSGADIIVEPDTKIYGLIGWTNFLKPEEVIKSGETAMEEKMPELLELINNWK